MKILQLIIFLLVPGFLFSCEKAWPALNLDSEEQNTKTYFINTQDDFNKWSNFEFSAGSKVLFAAGKTFAGEFILRGSGSETSPNLAAAYNSETGKVLTEWIDNKPVIQGEGKVI